MATSDTGSQSLGRPDSEYAGHSGVKFFIYMLLSMAGLCGLAPYGIYRSNELYDESGGLLTAVGVLLGLLYSVAALNNLGPLIRGQQRVRLYENGIEYGYGRKLHTFMWEELAQIASSITDDKVQAKFETRDKFFGKIGSGEFAVDQAARIVEYINSKTAAHFVPRYVKLIQEGTPVQFGPLTLSTNGITYGQTTVSWDRISGIDVADNEVWVGLVRQPQPWVRLGAQSIYNNHMLADIAAQMKASQPSEPPQPNQEAAPIRQEAAKAPIEETPAPDKPEIDYLS
jgi:hypothetical protein